MTLKTKGKMTNPIKTNMIKETNRHHKRHRRGHSAERLHNDPAFASTRKNWAEFASAGKGAILLRNVMESMLEPVHDRRRHCLLTKVMMKVLQSDSSHPKGERQLASGNLQLLKHVELNTGIPFSHLVYMGAIEGDIHRSSSKLQFLLEQITPAEFLAPPSHATHFEFIIAGAEIDFPQHTYHRKWASTGMLPLDVHINKMTLTVKMDKQSQLPWFLFLAVNFYTNGHKDPYNAVIILSVCT